MKVDIRVSAKQDQPYRKEVGKHVLWQHLKEPGIIEMKETKTKETKIIAFNRWHIFLNVHLFVLEFIQWTKVGQW